MSSSLSSTPQLNQLLRVALISLSLLLGVLAGCSGGGGGGGGGNTAPVASDGSYTTPEDTAVNGTLSATDADSNPLTFTIVTNGSKGTAVITNATTGAFTYTPNQYANGPDTFEFLANDGTANSNVATVTINITPVNDPPVANAGPDQVANPSTAVTLSGSGTDVDGSIASYLWEQIAGPLVTIGNPNSASTSLTTPAGTSWTTLTFRLTVTDNEGATDTDTVDVTRNLPPVATNGCFNIFNDTPPTITSVPVSLPANDVNGDSTIVSYTIETAPINGAVAECSGGYPCTRSSPDVTYVPTDYGTGRRGMDKFRFHVTDSGGLNSPAATAWILNNGKVRIMALGDSITRGISPPLSEPYYVSYRQKLYDDLNTLSPGRIDFVGSITTDGNLAGPPAFDRDHEGRDGWCAVTPCGSFGAISPNVEQWLSDNPADIVLLHIGTNDLDPSINRTDANGVASILDNVDSWETSNFLLSVFVAKIIDDVDGVGTELPVTTYNNNLQNMLDGRTADRVIPVDMQNGAGLVYTLAGDMADNLHPKDSGYRKMADQWKSHLLAPPTGKALGVPSCQ